MLFKAYLYSKTYYNYFIPHIFFVLPSASRSNERTYILCKIVVNASRDRVDWRASDTPLLILTTTDLIFFCIHIKKKFKIIFTLKWGHEGQLICIQKNIKLAAIYEKGQCCFPVIHFFTYVYVRVLNTRQWMSLRTSVLSTPFVYVRKKTHHWKTALIRTLRVLKISLYPSYKRLIIPIDWRNNLCSPCYRVFFKEWVSG